MDNLKQNPALALLPDSGDIIPPSIFRVLLPVCTSWFNIPDIYPHPSQVAIPIYESQTEEWIEPLGTSFPPEHELSPANFEHFPEAKKSALQHLADAKHYRMSTWAGPSSPSVASNSTFVFKNDLDKLTTGLIIDTIRIYYDRNGFTGLLLLCTNKTRTLHGAASGQMKDFHFNGRSALGVQIAVNETEGGGDNKTLLSIIHMAISFSDLKVETITCGAYKPNSRQMMYSSAPATKETKWDLAGFYSNYNATAKRLECLGVIWSNDIDRPPMTILPQHMDIDNFPPNLKKYLEPHMSRYDEWRLSDFAGSVDFSNDPGVRIDLGGQEIKPYQRIQKLEFWFNEWSGTSCLVGMRQTWNNRSGTEKTELVVGKTESKYSYTAWENTYKASYRLILAWFLSGKITTPAPNPKTFEFVRQIDFTIQDEWQNKLYSVSSLPEPKRVDEQLKKLPVPEPTSHILDSKPPEQGWSIRGFYSETGDVIDRLGVIWGPDAPWA